MAENMIDIDAILGLESNKAKKKKKVKRKSRDKDEAMPQIDPLLAPFGDDAEEELRRKLEKKFKKLKRKLNNSDDVRKPSLEKGSRQHKECSPPPLRSQVKTVVRTAHSSLQRPSSQSPPPFHRSKSPGQFSQYNYDDEQRPQSFVGNVVSRPVNERPPRGSWRGRGGFGPPSPRPYRGVGVRPPLNRRGGPAQSAQFRPYRCFTGYEHRDEGRSPSPELPPPSRPSPPRDMPEHIRWLHERWKKYDKNFFKENPGKKPEKVPTKGPTAEERETYRTQMAEFRKEKRKSPTGANTEPLGAKRKFLEAAPTQPTLKAHFSVPYYQFRKGADYQTPLGRMYTFKEFLMTQQKDLGDQDEVVRLYNDYKLTFRQKSLADFFQAHGEEEWFLEKYHPMIKTGKEARRRHVVQKRLDMFMQLLVRGWMEVRLDLEESRKLRKLLDAGIVLLEGGDEGDIACLSDLDYMLEEKKEASYEVDKKEPESEEEEEEKEVGKAPGGGRTKEEQEEDGELGPDHAEELELMQHARDYSLYIKEKTLDLEDMPDNLGAEEPERKTEYVGSGVFVSQVIQPKGLEEMNLHRVSALLLRNIPPTATRAELEQMLQGTHGGYLRLHLSDPDPHNNYHHYAIASFWHNANSTKILWKIRGTRIRNVPVIVLEYREFQRRILTVDGLAADKSVVLRDVQLCKSLVEFLDRKAQLWGAAASVPAQASSEEPPKVNPLLINLDECLAFHLRELMDSGKEDGGQKPSGKVERDEDLTRILDRLILYLRMVHSVDYYGCRMEETEDERPRRIGPMTVRGEPTRKATPNSLTSYIRKFEERLKTLLPQEGKLAEEHVELIGKRNTEAEVDKFIDGNILSVSDGMSKCCLCFKRFTSPHFAQMHFKERHGDKLEEVRWVVVCFNNYLADPNRPSAPDLAAAMLS